MVMSVGPDLSK